MLYCFSLQNTKVAQDPGKHIHNQGPALGPDFDVLAFGKM